MYISIRRYKPNSADAANEFTRRVNKGFVPIISKAPGFIAYYGINAGNGVWASVSIFKTKAGAEKSNKMAADWVKQNVASLVLGPPEITTGEAVVHKTA